MGTLHRQRFAPIERALRETLAVALTAISTQSQVGAIVGLPPYDPVGFPTCYYLRILAMTTTAAAIPAALRMMRTERNPQRIWRRPRRSLERGQHTSGRLSGCIDQPSNDHRLFWSALLNSEFAWSNRFNRQVPLPDQPSASPAKGLCAPIEPKAANGNGIQSCTNFLNSCVRYQIVMGQPAEKSEENHAAWELPKRLGLTPYVDRLRELNASVDRSMPS